MAVLHSFFKDQCQAKILKHHSGISGQWVNLGYLGEDFSLKTKHLLVLGSWKCHELLTCTIKAFTMNKVLLIGHGTGLSTIVAVLLSIAQCIKNRT